MEQFSERSLEQLDPYNHAFVATVLRLQEIAGTPTMEQFQGALKTLTDYYMELAAATDRGEDIDEDWLEGKDAGFAGQEHAFYFVKFGIVTIPDPEQVHALQRWLGSPAQLLH
jgi:hypothetical protein